MDLELSQLYSPFHQSTVSVSFSQYRGQMVIRSRNYGMAQEICM